MGFAEHLEMEQEVGVVVVLERDLEQHFAFDLETQSAGNCAAAFGLGLPVVEGSDDMFGSVYGLVDIHRCPFAMAPHILEADDFVS